MSAGVAGREGLDPAREKIDISPNTAAKTLAAIASATKDTMNVKTNSIGESYCRALTREKALSLTIRT